MTAIPEWILKGWQVLVIDDEPDASEVTQYLLEMYGANVMTASSGNQGLELVNIHKPRFIICDVSMPDVSGLDVVKQLKSQPATSSIPVIALTAHAMAGDREKLIAQGFHTYLSKPVRPETFVEQLVDLLAEVFPELREPSA